MNILILHRIPYYKIEYHRGIDHKKHNVIYIGTNEALANIPAEIPCTKVIRLGERHIVNEVFDFIINSNICFDNIISLSEYELIAAAKLRELCSLKGPSQDQVMLVRDKVIMKRALQGIVRTPIFMLLSEIFRDNSFPKDVPVVIKPIDGASSENVIILANIEDVKKRLLNKSTGLSDLDNRLIPFSSFEIEEYIEGEILHIDGIVQHGKVLISQASQYVGNCLAYANGMPLASVQIENSRAIQEWAQKCVTATQIEQGCFHLEAINTTNGLVFLEIANRVGGADVVKTFELRTGLHLPSSELKLMLGENIQLSNLKFKNYFYGWFVYPGHIIESGYAKIVNTEKFSTHPYIHHWQQSQESHQVARKISYQPNEVPLSGILKGDNPQLLSAFISDLFKTVKIFDKSIFLDEVA